MRVADVGGCLAKFRPWARGESTVLELKVDGKWHAITAGRLPEQLDDEIKKLQYAWRSARLHVTAEDILKAGTARFSHDLSSSIGSASASQR